ncbi:MAG: chromosomal replication initiator protein DnaA [Clostridiales bacterium]|nr:chromosomal replication initiator protein DnaA [Clostridiales bacterium]
MNEDIWSQTLKIIALDSRVDDVIKNMVLKKIKQVSYENNILVLSCRDQFSLDLVKGQELETYISKSVNMVSDNDISVKYIIEGDDSAAINTILSETKVKEKERQAYPSSGLTDDYTFENFIVGDCNRFAYASAFSVAENPGLRYKNPLYLWGNSGLGKTHLMKAVGYKVKQLFPDKNVLYTTCEEFTNAYVTCMRNKNYEDFRNKYRSIDVLLIDDIQFLIDKEGTQMEFFNTFETLVSSGKQIVITSDKSPKSLPELDPRLTSRFQSGVMMDIQPPDYETRKAIFLKKMDSVGISFDDDIVKYICENVTNNVRELNGAFNIVSSYYALENGNINLDLVVSKLAPLISPNKKKAVTTEIIIDAVSKYYDITPDKIMSKLKSAEIVNARSVAMFICRDMLEMQFTKIGESFGGKKHTTVMHACNNVSESDTLLADVKIIEKRIADV